MKNTIKIRALECLSSAFGYFAKIITRDNPNPTKYVAKLITQDIDKYENATCIISNLEITDEVDLFQLIFNVLHKKSHVFKVSMN